MSQAPPDPVALEERIYEAAILPGLWRGVLADFTNLADGEGALIFRGTPDGSRWLSTDTMPDPLLEAYFSHEGAAERLRRLLQRGQSSFVTDEDVFSPDELSNSPLHRDFLMARGMGRGIATVLGLPNRETVVLHVERRHDRGPLPDTARGTLEILRPHLARSAMMAARLAFQSLATAVATLESLGLAACAVDRMGRVITENTGFAAASALWTTRAMNHILLTDSIADLRLQRLLRQAATGARPASLPLSSHDGGHPAVLHVVPVVRQARDLFTGAAAVLVLSQAGRTFSPGAPPLLRALFDLTEAEANVATAIASGQSVGGIATAKGVAVDTVRGQLKSVMAKTGCHRQADLVRVLVQLLAH